MNKVVLTTLMASAILVLSGCSSTGSHHSGYGNSKGSYCPECGPGSHSVRHAHGNRSRGGGSSFATVAGALVVGGLLINALDDDDDSSSSHNK